MKQDERLAALVPVREFSDDQFLFFATKKGVVKKSRLSEFGNPRSVGIRAINIAAASITADRLSVLQLSAITADMGSLTAGTITGGRLRPGTKPNCPA